MSYLLRAICIVLLSLVMTDLSAQITGNTCAMGSTFRQFSNYAEDVADSNMGTAVMQGSGCNAVRATWTHTGADRGEDYGGDIRFRTSNGDSIVLNITFDQALVNPVVYIGAMEPNNRVTIKDGTGTVIPGQMKIAGSGDLTMSGDSWINSTGGGTSQQNASVEFSGSYSALQICIVNNGTDDGIDIDFGACIADPTGPTPPTTVMTIPCSSGEQIYTIDHTSLTAGTLPGGITVATEIAGTISGSQSTQNFTSIGNVDPNVPTNVTSGGLLRFQMTNDGDNFTVKYTFSTALTNPFIYIGDSGPETATTFNVFELDGTTPIPVGFIDGETGFLSTGNKIGTNVNNVSGYVQIQDNTARTGLVIQVINDTDPPCFVGTADPDNGAEDGFRIAVGACVNPAGVNGGPTAQDIPTMGQWGLIVLTLLCLIFGVVALPEWETA